MRIKQALVACGGTGSRLREEGMDFDLAKPFIQINDKALLYWCLSNLHLAGIKRVVLSTDTHEKKEAAQSVLDCLPFSFSEVSFSTHLEKGVTGCAFHARPLLDEHFMVEFGHNLSGVAQYEALDSARTQDGVVFSGYQSNIFSPRTYVRVKRDSPYWKNGEYHSDADWAVSYPILANQTYASRLPSLNFDWTTVVRTYCDENALVLVPTDGPIEVDTLAEWEGARQVYEQYIAQHPFCD